MQPHHKNRSRAQSVVVAAAFELGAPQLALGLANDIRDWRRGTAYADYGVAMARRGERAEAARYLELALTVREGESRHETAQEWRLDMISLKAARGYTVLGDSKRAAEVSAGIDASSANAVDNDWAEAAAERVRTLEPSVLPAELAAIDRDFPTMSLGQQNTTLFALAQMHERFFAEVETRRAIEARLTTRFDKLPPSLRVPPVATLVHTNLRQGDLAGAKQLVTAIRDIIEAHRWRPEHRLPEYARLAELTHAIGDADRARAEATAALQAYHEQREQIVDIDRAEALRPLALAWYAMGDVALAEGLLAQAIEEGMENPNSRPRCDDLVDTLVALAKRRIEPSAAIWTRIREIVAGLGDPW
jgi:tetratricopeptide (TPR) repeat protein